MIGLRCNYATIDASGLISDRRAGRIHDTAALSRAVATGVDLSRFGVEIAFCSGAGHRAALAIQGDHLGPHVSSNDPKREGVPPAPFRPIGDDPDDRKTASVLGEFVRQSTEILSSHPVNRERISMGLPPANTVLCRGAGIMGNFEPFQEKYGMRGAVISAATLITGIGKVVGLVHVPVSGATGSLDSNIEGKIIAAIEALKDWDFILVNIKGADEAGHDGLALEKRDFISRIDGAIEPLLDLEDCLLVVCADHSTPCSIKDHSADPVPLVIRGDGVRVDHVTEFNEYACAEGGGLHRIKGSSLMPIVMDLLNLAHKYGA